DPAAATIAIAVSITPLQYALDLRDIRADTALPTAACNINLTSRTDQKRMSRLSALWLSAVELSKLYARGEVSPVEVVDTMLKRASALQPHLNALVLVDEEGARAAAKASEGRWKTGTQLSPFDGIPTTIKDTTN